MAQADNRISRKDGLAYWNSVDSTVNGMLGGYPQISRVDMRGSLSFISKIRKGSKESRITRAADIGAGIGRITAGVLSRVADTTDIIEPTAKFADEARQLGTTGNATSMGDGKIGEVYMVGMEDWLPNHSYDLIWFQWCLGHLTREQTVTCLARCRDALSKDGWIVVKENNSTDASGEDMFDSIDSSVTRTDESYRSLFAKAGLKIFHSEVQKGFPAELFPVSMYALRAG